MKRTLLSLFALTVLFGSLSIAKADTMYRHCWYSHHHRHCR